MVEPAQANPPQEVIDHLFIESLFPVKRLIALVVEHRGDFARGTALPAQFDNPTSQRIVIAQLSITQDRTPDLVVRPYATGPMDGHIHHLSPPPRRDHDPLDQQPDDLLAVAACRRLRLPKAGPNRGQPGPPRALP